MAMKFDREPYEALSIDMTPMVDAIFALVLFILVAADFQDSLEQDLTIQLPTKGKVTEPVAGKPERITVNVRHIGGGPGAAHRRRPDLQQEPARRAPEQGLHHE